MLKQIINQDEEPESGETKSEEGAKQTAAPAEKPQSKSKPSMSSGKNILSSDVEIRGKLRFANDLIIDGRIEGEVNSEGDLTVGENAQVVGDIKTRSVVVFGKVKGNISVTDRCELKQNAELHGDVVAGKLAIEEGAAFMGSSAVGNPTNIGSAKPASGSPQGGSPGGGGDGSK